MLSFNDVSIKSADDLQEALLTEMDAKAFADQVKNMIDRWGNESALQMLYFALYGTEGVKPLIRPTHRIVDNFPINGDPTDYYREKIR